MNAPALRTAPVVIFDLDGTLIDSAPAIHRVSNLVLADFDLPPLDADTVRSFVGKGTPNLVRQLLEASGKDPEGAIFDEVHDRLVARYEKEVEGNTLYPGVVTALEALTEAGFRLGICTNKPYRPAEAALHHVGLFDTFEALLGGDSLATRKPDPAMLHHVHRQLGGGPMLYVGDSEVDAETAVNARAPFALYTEGYRKTPVADLPHHATFSDYAALPGIAERFQ
ncbi:phosphoglycolate phosphatase [Acidimangrovimonas sediminis]|uniref:phosphoglycolate phosphatase n=1 Tax=Acidimangrovimonas sediminis TaxID=2056283 RepID=UPI000C8021EF|nr:phosphoglycolate phosphatase [Acidimangrovimonas sediminis]